MIRVLAADDHAVVREGLKQVVAETPDIVIAGEAGNAQEVLDEVEQGGYDVVLMDIAMPGRSGLDVLRQLRTEHHDLAVLILTIFPETQYAVRALRAGAAGYLTKESLPEELIDAIRTVAKGRKYISRSLAEVLAVDLDHETDKPLHQKLSDREYEVMCQIALGKTVTEIAEDLSLSVKTVSTYRSRIMEKMDMKSNAELTRYALQNGLVR